ncbi:lysophospholipid acyltransferase 6 [Hyalella azteca]|uniref:Lysophospholipid acyltransferase 6 n=1 Tax=Hyalella azteca TaxID=294128 RepID=A0A8B7NGW6_HYAAZ|nr:lysophospholipid acyltransferase 6 [Hyalella azteca]
MALNVNFIFAQLMAIALSFVLRTRLPPLPGGDGYTKQQQEHRQQQRHQFALISGLLLTYFCFGKQTLLALVLAGVCYMLLWTIPAVSVHRVTLVACMSFLSAAHVYRQSLQQAAFVIDITGPLMLMVQRISTVALGLHDGLTKTPEKMTSLQRYNSITKKPSALEYFSYLLSFQSILAGPFLMYCDYRDHINGNDEFSRAVLQYKSVKQAQLRETDRAPEGSSNPPLVPLKPVSVAFRKLALGALFGISTVCIASRFPVSLLTGLYFAPRL